VVVVPAQALTRQLTAGRQETTWRLLTLLISRSLSTARDKCRFADRLQPNRGGPKAEKSRRADVLNPISGRYLANSPGGVAPGRGQQAPPSTARKHANATRVSGSIGRSGRSPHRHHAEPGIEVYVDAQDQVAWPSGKRAKFTRGPCSNRDAGFHFDLQAIAVAKKVALPRSSRLNISARSFSFAAVTEGIT
jgi:hypothetical protein